MFLQFFKIIIYLFYLQVDLCGRRKNHRRQGTTILNPFLTLMQRKQCQVPVPTRIFSEKVRIFFKNRLNKGSTVRVY